MTFARDALGEMKELSGGKADRSSSDQGGVLPNPGEFHYRSQVDPDAPSEQHIDTPRAIGSLQKAVKSRNRSDFETFSKEHNAQVKRTTLRGLLDFVPVPEAEQIPLNEVESAQELVKRFRSGAMSYGSISEESHKAIGVAMNRMGAQSNSGEGGEDEQRWKRAETGDLASSSIKQVASGRFGVNIEYLTYANEIQIKIAQGAKPGEGGELAASKITPEIAKTRMTQPGVGLISPPPHHDIYSIEDLKQLIWDLKNANPLAKISVKLVSKAGVGVIAAGVAKAMANHITISGWSGGTGSAKVTSIKHCGAPWETGLAETHQTLIANGLRDLVTLETDGHLRSGADVVKAAIIGADYFGFGTAPLIALGCIMMRQCHTGLCPVGIATQDPNLRKMFKGQPEYVVNYFFLVAEEVRAILAKLGVRSLGEIVGQTQYLKQVDASQTHPKAATLDLSPLLTKSEPYPGISAAKQRQEDSDREMANRLDQKMHEQLREQLGRALPSFLSLPISNLNRTVGASLSNDLVKMHGPHAPNIADDTVAVEFHGHAGQSFGAFLAHGVSLTLEGDANDGVGKGLSGGMLAIRPPRDMPKRFKPEENVIIGNACLYGASSGRLFASGIAGERFGVRCSGALAVVEGCGDHGCSYMTGGRVVILGDIGENFASGMSGGIAYVYDPEGTNQPRISTAGIDLLQVGERDGLLHSLVQQHFRWTGSPMAARILSSWEESVHHFVKVFPTDYRAVLRKDFAERDEAEKRTLARLKPKKLHQLDSRSYSTATAAAKRKTVTRKKKGAASTSEPPLPTSAAESVKQAGGFMLYGREPRLYKPPKTRVKNFEEIWQPRDNELVTTQAARCMDCGVPFCHDNASFGCPLGNKIPEWNELVHRGRWYEAFVSLKSTNNFPEWTSKVCPAPCEGACVLGIIKDPVAIKSIELAIIEKAYEEGWMKPNPPTHRTGKRVAIVGSGPAGLAAADQLNQMGHWVTVYERADRGGGLMQYGVPHPKINKEKMVQGRIRILEQEGVTLVTGEAGTIGGAAWLMSNKETRNGTSMESLESEFDAVLLAIGSTIPRNLEVPHSDAPNIYPAMKFLHSSQKALEDSGNVSKTWRRDLEKADGWVDVKGKNVVVVGSGDTGTDCLATSVRMGAKSVALFDIVPQPPNERMSSNPWPEQPLVLRTEYGHQEAKAVYGGADPRQFSVTVSDFITDEDGNLSGVRTHKIVDGNIVPDSKKVWPADVVFLAMGFLGPEVPAGSEKLLNPRKLYETKAFQTSNPKIFAAGDCRRGQSLVVWAITEGRGAANKIHSTLMKSKD